MAVFMASSRTTSLSAPLAEVDGSLDAVPPGRSRNLASNTPAGERGRPGRHHCSISRLVGPEHRRQADGLLQLPQSVDCGSSCSFCFAKAAGMAILLAGAFRRRLPTRNGSDRSRSSFKPYRNLQKEIPTMCCGQKRKELRNSQAQSTTRSVPNTSPAIAALRLSAPNLRRLRQ